MSIKKQNMITTCEYMRWVCSTDNFLITYILSVSLNLGWHCITSHWGEFKTKNANYVYIHVFGIFCCFSSTNLCFYHFYFHFFIDKGSSICNKILTNQKPESVIRNCQWNFMKWNNDFWYYIWNQFYTTE